MCSPETNIPKSLAQQMTRGRSSDGSEQLISNQKVAGSSPAVPANL